MTCRQSICLHVSSLCNSAHEFPQKAIVMFHGGESRLLFQQSIRPRNTTRTIRIVRCRGQSGHRQEFQIFRHSVVYIQSYTSLRNRREDGLSQRLTSGIDIDRHQLLTRSAETKKYQQTAALHKSNVTKRHIFTTIRNQNREFNCYFS